MEEYYTVKCDAELNTPEVVEKNELCAQITIKEDFFNASKIDSIYSESLKTAEDYLEDKPYLSEIVLEQLLKCDPENISALSLLGLVKHRLGKNEEAIEILQAILDMDSTNSEAWNVLGLSYSAIGNITKAIQCIKKAIEFDPGQNLYLNNLATNLHLEGQTDLAIEYLEKAIEQNQNAQMWLNLGGMYGEKHELDKAESCFVNAIKLKKNYAAAYVDLAFCYHLKGDWKTGFAAFEWRFLYYSLLSFYHNVYDFKRLWNGTDDLTNKRVIVYCEQGLGDSINFARYAKNLKEKGAYVIMHCPLSVESVISGIEGVDETFVFDISKVKPEDLPYYDYQMASMSLPYLLNVESISGTPYIVNKREDHKQTIKESYSDTFNIGIVWAGSPDHPHDRHRSFHLHHLTSIHDTPGVKLFSLQFDPPERSYGISHSSPNATRNRYSEKGNKINFSENSDHIQYVDMTSSISDFSDTMSILSGLDLLICCDTATAHLAGAMGIPVWMAVNYNPDWRWTLSGNTTHWYDSVKLYRQKVKGSWKEVFEEMKRDLDKILLQNKR